MFFWNFYIAFLFPASCFQLVQDLKATSRRGRNLLAFLGRITQQSSQVSNHGLTFRTMVSCKMPMDSLVNFRWNRSKLPPLQTPAAHLATTSHRTQKLNLKWNIISKRKTEKRLINADYKGCVVQRYQQFSLRLCTDRTSSLVRTLIQLLLWHLCACASPSLCLRNSITSSFGNSPMASW